jgi:hypothetical protein
MTLEQAREALHSVGLSAKGISGNGLVQSQAVAPGAVVPLGMQVVASLSHEVTFLVTSSASSALVTWTAPGSFSIQQDNGAALPWSVTFSRPTTPSAHARGVISAQMDAWDGWITCEILVDGKTVETQTSTGAFAIVMCG